MIISNWDTLLYRTGVPVGFRYKRRRALKCLIWMRVFFFKKLKLWLEVIFWFYFLGVIEWFVVPIFCFRSRHFKFLHTRPIYLNYRLLLNFGLDRTLSFYDELFWSTLVVIARSRTGARPLLQFILLDLVLEAVGFQILVKRPILR